MMPSVRPAGESVDEGVGDAVGDSVSEAVGDAGDESVEDVVGDAAEIQRRSWS